MLDTMVRLARAITASCRPPPVPGRLPDDGRPADGLPPRPEESRLLSAFGRAFKTPELRNKLLFTIGIIVIYRLGTFVPAPGVDYGNVQQLSLIHI